MFLEKGKKPVLLRWKELTSTIGQTVQVRSGAETITGIAEGIDDDGMLLIRLPGGPVKRVSSGEVAYMP
jgi:BirA family biotin operon repressor/biotin-[acetyl-CoA-carboxylase] ligase